MSTIASVKCDTQQYFYYDGLMSLLQFTTWITLVSEHNKIIITTIIPLFIAIVFKHIQDIVL